MSKKIWIYLFAFLLLLQACNSQNNSENIEPTPSSEDTLVVATEIPFTLAKNYFVKNTYGDAPLHALLFNTQADFDSIFGMASFMGEEGKPTTIDFESQTILALVGQITDFSSSLEVKSVQKKEADLILSYRLNLGEKQSASIRPLVLLLVDKQIEGNIQLERVD